MIYNKITVGFVVQTYKNERCVSQEFIAGNQVDYEYIDGTPLEKDKTGKENYFPCNMEQPE